MMKRSNRFLVLIALGLMGECILGVSCLGEAFGGAWAVKRDVTLLVVPARPRLIQLAFDMVQLRSVAVVSFHGTAQTAEPVLHLWSGTEWQYVPMADFTDGKFLIAPPQKVIVIGDDQTVPGVLLYNVAGCSDMERLQTMNVADLVNGLDRALRFKEREWKWLAGRYGLTLIDLNAERRKVNPYDTPRSKLPLETREFKQEKGELAPAQLIETNPPASSAKPEDTSAEKPPK